MGYNYMSYIIHLWLSQITQIIIIISQLFICVSFSDHFIAAESAAVRRGEHVQKQKERKVGK